MLIICTNYKGYGNNVELILTCISTCIHACSCHCIYLFLTIISSSESFLSSSLLISSFSVSTHTCTVVMVYPTLVVLSLYICSFLKFYNYCAGVRVIWRFVHPRQVTDMIESLRNHTCTAACTYSGVRKPVSVKPVMLGAHYIHWFWGVLFFCSAHVNAYFGVDGHVMHVRMPNVPALPYALILTGFSIALQVHLPIHVWTSLFS